MSQTRTQVTCHNCLGKGTIPDVNLLPNTGGVGTCSQCRGLGLVPATELKRPLPGALRASRAANECCCGETNPEEYCSWCLEDAEIIAEESGLSNILRAIEHANLSAIREGGSVKILDCEWNHLLFEAQRVKEA